VPGALPELPHNVHVLAVVEFGPVNYTHFFQNANNITMLCVHYELRAIPHTFSENTLVSATNIIMEALEPGSSDYDAHKCDEALIAHFLSISTLTSFTVRGCDLPWLTILDKSSFINSSVTSLTLCTQSITGAPLRLSLFNSLTSEIS
jgi:hypothetical protein